jgi:hypothetical protein
VAGLQAYGNSALGLLLCVGSNTIGIVTGTFFLRTMFNVKNAFWRAVQGFSLSMLDIPPQVDAVGLLRMLILNVLVPLAIGKAILEAAPPVRHFTKRRTTLLKLLNDSYVISIVWQTISLAEARHPPMHVCPPVHARAANPCGVPRYRPYTACLALVCAGRCCSLVPGCERCAVRYYTTSLYRHTGTISQLPG